MPRASLVRDFTHNVIHVLEWNISTYLFLNIMIGYPFARTGLFSTGGSVPGRLIPRSAGQPADRILNPYSRYTCFKSTELEDVYSNSKTSDQAPVKQSARVSYN